MLRILVGIALLVTAPLAAAPILVNGSGYANDSWGHLDLSGEGVYFSAALVSSVRGEARCRAGALCNITIEGGGGADNVFDLTEEHFPIEG